MCSCSEDTPIQITPEEKELEARLDLERYLGGLEAEVSLLKEMLKDLKDSSHPHHYHYPYVPCQLNHYPSTGWWTVTNTIPTTGYGTYNGTTTTTTNRTLPPSTNSN